MRIDNPNPNESTMQPYAIASVFKALDTLTENHPLPSNLNFEKFKLEIGRFASFTPEQKQNFAQQFLSLFPKAENPLFQYTCANRAIWIEIQTLQAKLQDIPPEGKDRKKTEILLARFLEIQRELFEKTLRLFLEEIATINNTALTPAQEEGHSNIIQQFCILLYKEEHWDTGFVYRPNSSVHEVRHIRLHQVFILLLHAIQFQEKFKSPYPKRLQKLYKLLCEGRVQVDENSKKYNICNTGVRNKFVEKMLHRDYENIYFITELDTDLQILTQEFLLNRLMDIEKENPELAFQIYCQWMLPDFKGKESEEFFNCKNALFDFLVSRMTEMGLNTHYIFSESSFKFSDESLQREMTKQMGAFELADCPPHPRFGKALLIFERLWKNRAHYSPIIQECLASIKTFSDIEKMGLPVYYDFRTLVENAQKIYQLKDFDTRDPIILGKEEADLKLCIEEIQADFSQREKDSNQNWSLNTDIVLQHQENYRKFYALIEGEKILVELIGNSFSNLVGEENIDNRNKMVSRVQKAFEEYHFHLDDEALEAWLKSRENQQVGEQVFAPHDINRILWQALLTSPIEWSESFKAVLQKMLELMEKPFPEDQLHAETNKSSYPPKLIKQIQWLIRLREYPYIMDDPDLFVRCNLEGLKQFSNYDEFFDALAETPSEKRLEFIRVLYFEELFLSDANLKELSQLFSADHWGEALDWMLQDKVLPTAVCVRVLNSTLKFFKHKKDRLPFFSKILNEAAWPNLRGIAMKRILPVTVNADFYPALDLRSFFKIFSINDRIQLFRLFKVGADRFSLEDFFEILKEIPENDRKKALQSITAGSLHISDLSFLPEIAKNIVHFQPSDCWPILFSKFSREHFSHLFKGKTYNILSYLEEIGIDRRLPFLQALSSYLHMIYDFNHSSDVFKTEFLQLFSEGLEDFEDEDRKTFLDWVGEQLGKCRFLDAKILIENYFPVIEKSEYHRLISPNALWAKTDKQKYLVLLQEFNEEDWARLETLFNWKALPKAYIYYQIFLLPDEIRDKAKDFFDLKKEDLNDPELLVGILCSMRALNWDGILKWITGEDQWSAVINSHQQLIQIVSCFKKDQILLPLGSGLPRERLLETFLKLKIGPALKQICKINTEIIELAEACPDSFTIWDLWPVDEKGCFEILQFFSQKKSEDSLSEEQKNLLEKNKFNQVMRFIEKTPYAFDPNQLGLILNLFPEATWENLSYYFALALRSRKKEMDSSLPNFLQRLYSILGNSKKFISALKALSYEFKTPDFEHDYDPDKGLFIEAFNLNIAEEINSFIGSSLNLKNTNDQDFLNEILIELLPLLGTCSAPELLKIEKLYTGDQALFAKKLADANWPEKIKRDFLKEYLLNKSSEILALFTKFLSVDKWLAEPVFSIELSLNLISFVSLRDYEILKVFKAYETKHWSLLLKKIGAHKVFNAFSNLDKEYYAKVFDTLAEALFSTLEKNHHGKPDENLWAINELKDITQFLKMIPREQKSNFIRNFSEKVKLAELNPNANELRDFILQFPRKLNALDTLLEIDLHTLPGFDQMYFQAVQSRQNYELLEQLPEETAGYRLVLLAPKLHEIFPNLVGFLGECKTDHILEILERFNPLNLMCLQLKHVIGNNLPDDAVPTFLQYLKNFQQKLPKHPKFLAHHNFFRRMELLFQGSLETKFDKLKKLWEKTSREYSLRPDTIYHRVLSLLEPLVNLSTSFFSSKKTLAMKQHANTIMDQLKAINENEKIETPESRQALIQNLAAELEKAPDADSDLALALHFAITALSSGSKQHRGLIIESSNNNINIKPKEPLRITFLFLEEIGRKDEKMEIFIRSLSHNNVCNPFDRNLAFQFLHWEERNQIGNGEVLWIFKTQAKHKMVLSEKIPALHRIVTENDNYDLSQNLSNFIFNQLNREWATIESIFNNTKIHKPISVTVNSNFFAPADDKGKEEENQNQGLRELKK